MIVNAALTALAVVVGLISQSIETALGIVCIAVVIEIACEIRAYFRIGRRQ